MITVQRLTPEYFEAKARVHSQTWRETYQGLLPQWLVDKITPQFALKVTSARKGADTFIALDGGEVIGFAEYSDPARPPSDGLGAAELDSIYVLKSRQGSGAGRLLFEAVQHAVSTPKMVIWAFQGNINVRGFYGHMGFHATGRTQDEDDGASHEIEFANFAIS